MARQYSLPQVIVQQEFASIPAAAVQELLAVIVGPQKKFVNIGDIDEENYVAYGEYNKATDTDYDIKGLDATDVIEPNSVEVTFQDALAKYVTISGTNKIEATSELNKIKLGAGYTDTLGLAEYLDSNRISDLANRDVKVGDRLKVNYGTGILATRVMELINEVSEPEVGSTTNGASNPSTAAANFSSTAVESDGGYVVNAHGTNAYVGNLAAGYIEDTYTLEVVTGGAAGVAEFDVTSVKGDNASGVVVAANASPISIGTHGLVVTMATGTGNHVVGDKYTVEVRAAYERYVPVVSPSSVEDFVGSVDTTYEIKVVKGGLWSENPQVTVTTNNGIDSYGAQVVTAHDSELNLGTLGLKFTTNADDDPAQGGLLLGDTYYVTAVASAKGPIRTIRMADSLPDSVSSGTDLSVDFFIPIAEITIPSNGYPLFGSEAWELSEDGREITLKSGIQVLHEEWVDGLDAPIPMDVESADVLVEYKALVKANSNRLIAVESVDQIESLLGEVIPENPIAYAVNKALLNSGEKVVYAVTVETDDVEGYTTALEVTEGTVASYYIVPLTQNNSVIQLVKAHVLSQSEPQNSMERVAFVNNEFDPIDDLYNTKPASTEKWSGYVTLKSGTSANYTIVTVPGASFLTDGIRVGDEFRSNFGIDAFGNESYEAHEIFNVIDEENLELAGTGFDDVVGADDNMKRIQIVRALTKLEQAEKIAQGSSDLGSRRVINVWPDFASDGDLLVPGYFVAAALAGLKSSVAPHQPVTNVSINGFTDVERSYKYFTPTQLNVIAGGGTWIVTRDPAPGGVAGIISRHQLTTDYSGDNTAEVSITTNLDSIAKWLRDDLKVVIGQFNNHPYMIDLIKTRLLYRLNYLKSNARTIKAGPQLIDYSIKKLEIDKIHKTKVNAQISLVLPYPINNVELNLVVVDEL